MTKPLMFTIGCLAAATALALVLTVSAPRAQERPSAAPSRATPMERAEIGRASCRERV